MPKPGWRNGLALVPVAAVLVLLPAAPSSAERGSAALLASPRLCTLCPSSVRVYGPVEGTRGDGPVVDRNGDGGPDASLAMAGLRGESRVHIALMSLGGKRVWDVQTPRSVDRYPGLSAAGDFTGDGVTDYVFGMTWHDEPIAFCGSSIRTWTQLLFVDGRNGAESLPLEALGDPCFSFPSAMYVVRQWGGGGTVAIGDLAPAYRGLEVVAVASYPPDHRAAVLNFAAAGRWQPVTGRGGVQTLLMPTTPEFDSYYSVVNGHPCEAAYESATARADSCYIANARAELALFVDAGQGRALLVFTSARALFYRPDLTPGPDFSWWSGTSENGGRNYGYAFSFAYRGTTYAELIGGCSVQVERRAMRTGMPPAGRPDTTAGGGRDAHCNIHHHFESFRLAGGRIAGHVNHYYGYSVDDGFFSGRPEYPGNPTGPIGGRGTLWTAFNLFDATPGSSTGEGQWGIELIPSPDNPEHVIRVPGWYVWDVVDLDHDGTAELLATRAVRRSGGAPDYVLPWRTDVLRWDGTTLVPVFHHAGVAPVVLSTPNGPTRFAATNATNEPTTVLPRDLDRDGSSEVLVEDRHGRRAFLRIPRRASGRNAAALRP